MLCPTAFLRGMIVGASLIGASVIRVAELMGVSRSTSPNAKSGKAKLHKNTKYKKKCNNSTYSRL